MTRRLSPAESIAACQALITGANITIDADDDAGEARKDRDQWASERDTDWLSRQAADREEAFMDRAWG